MGRPVPIYLKGYFAKDAAGRMVIAFAIQSLKKDESDV